MRDLTGRTDSGPGRTLWAAWFLPCGGAATVGVVLLYLCTDAAPGIDSITLITDAGCMMSGITGSSPDAIDILHGLS